MSEVPFYEDIKRYWEVWNMKSKWTSRKFLMALVTIAITVAVGLGYKVDMEVLAPVIGAEGALYIVIEGIIDAVGANRKGK